MKFASLIALLVASSAHADILVPMHRMWVWDGGMAADMGRGMWAGTGWDRFPGVSPPWNPISQPEVAPRWNSRCAAMPAPDPEPVVVVVQPASQPPPKTYTFHVAGQSVTVQAAK